MTPPGLHAFLTGFGRSSTKLSKVPRPSTRFRYLASATLVPLWIVDVSDPECLVWAFRRVSPVILELKAIQFKILLPRPRHGIIIPYLSSACAISFRTAFVCTVPSWAFESSYHGVVMAEQYSIALSPVKPTVNCFKSVWSTTSSVALVIGDLRVSPALTAQQFSPSIAMMACLQFEGRLGIPPLLGTPHASAVLGVY